jgi:hypothetical protein
LHEERLGRAAARRLGLRDVVAETDDDRPIR